MTKFKPDNQNMGEAALDQELNEQRAILFQAMGIVALATEALRDRLPTRMHVTNAWTALEGAYTLMNGVSDRLESCDTLMAKESADGP